MRIGFYEWDKIGIGHNPSQTHLVVLSKNDYQIIRITSLRPSVDICFTYGKSFAMENGLK